MAAKTPPKAAPKAAAPRPPRVERMPPPDGSILITRAQLEDAFNENSIRKLGSQPVEGQLDDLWARLGGK